MSAVVIVRGQVRAVRDLRKKADGGGQGEKFARSLSILTEAEDVLGETVGVLAWDNQFSGMHFTPGDVIEAIVEMDAGRFGLEGKLIKVVRVADVRPLPEESSLAAV